MLNRKGKKTHANGWQQKIPGILLAGVIAAPAWCLGNVLPVIGSPVIGIVLGMLLAFWKRPALLDPGIRYTSRMVLQFAIILLGFGMNLFSVLHTGAQTLLLMVFTLTAAFATAWLLGRALRVDRNSKILIGVGTAICGGSAIAATAPVIQADDEDVARSISTIFLFNVLAAFLFPALGHWMGMGDRQFGLWAGTAINDTSSVVAAGYSFSAAAGDLAVVVKLTRTLMIIPVTLALAIGKARREKGGLGTHYSFVKIFPWFVLGFVAAAVLNTFVPLGAYPVFSQIGKFMIVMAMAAIGLNTNLVRLVKNGGRAIALGLGCWIMLSLTSLAVQALL